MSKPDTFAQLQNPRHEIVRLAERRKQLQVRSSDPPIVSNCSHSKSLHFSATYLYVMKSIFFLHWTCVFPAVAPIWSFFWVFILENALRSITDGSAVYALCIAFAEFPS